jgi:hypothetical protein
MASAVRAYERQRASEHAWVLGAFVVPAGRLGELAGAMASEGIVAEWPVSVLVRSTDDATRALRDARGPWRVWALEVAPQDPKDIVARPRATEAPTFHEVPLDDGLDARLDAIASAGAAAKVRTGGIEPSAFPTPERLATFLGGCREREVPFKATAGLHHASRGSYPLTYEDGSARCVMFGFLDVVLAAALLWHRRIDTAEAAALLENRPAKVEVSSDALVWAGQRMSADEIDEARRRFFRSFGSCSFEEPVRDLAGLALL